MARVGNRIIKDGIEYEAVDGNCMFCTSFKDGHGYSVCKKHCNQRSVKNPNGIIYVKVCKMTKKKTKQPKRPKLTTIHITTAMHTRIIANKNHYEKKNSVKLTIAEYMDMQDKESRVDEMTSMHYQSECNRLSDRFGRLIEDFKTLQEASCKQSDEIIRLNAMIIRKGKK